MHIFCDFDGTVTRQDTTDLILSQLADPTWEAIETDWCAGKIDAASCMRQQIALLRAPLTAIDEILDTVELRDGFTSFLVWAEKRTASVTIVSDGVDYFINRILARNGIRSLPIVANRLVGGPSGEWRLEQPFRMTDCAAGSGVCKCNVLAAFEDRGGRVFVGDGRSDFCVSNKPDLLFATGKLTGFCRERSLPHIPFISFKQVSAALEQWTGRPVSPGHAARRAIKEPT